MSDCPEILAIKPFIYHATELEKINPIFSFYMKQFSIEKASAAYKKMKNEGKDTTLLGKSIQIWLNELEAQKKQCGDKLNNKDENKKEVVDFILKLFFRSDDEERNGNFTKQTAQNFQVVSRFFEMLAVFGPIPVDLNEKSLN